MKHNRPPDCCCVSSTSHRQIYRCMALEPNRLMLSEMISSYCTDIIILSMMGKNGLILDQHFG